MTRLAAERGLPCAPMIDPALDLAAAGGVARFNAIAQTVLRAGTMLAAAGSGAYRVKEEMNRVGRALGLEAVHADVTLNNIIITCQDGGRFATLVGTIPAVSVNAGRIADLEALALATRPGESLTRLNRRLDDIEARPGQYPRRVVALAAAFASAAFCLLNQGDLLECLCVAFAAAGGQWLRSTLGRYRLNQLTNTLATALLACLLYLGLLQVLALCGVAVAGATAGYIFVLLFLVPGFPLITAAVDLARFDLGAGMSRLTYAVLIVTVASLAAWLVSQLIPVGVLVPAASDLPAWENHLIRALASFFGVLGFALIFHTPVRIAAVAAVIGMLANLLRLMLVDLDWPLQMAAPAATLLVGLLAAWISPLLSCPRIVLSVPAVLVMIPGTTAYRALVAANRGEALDAMTLSCETVFIVGGIVMGLVLARMLTDHIWAFEGRVPGSGDELLSRRRHVGDSVPSGAKN